ncbi:MAG: hypothetical protein WA821_18580 [Anaerolineales bacterium]
MKKIRIVCVLTVLFLLLFLPGEARAQALDMVRAVVIQGDKGTPVAGENVRLHLYRYDFSASPNHVNVTDLDAGSCMTGADGRCEIWLFPGMSRDASGFYHGALEVRGMLRSILWPGGTLEVNLNLDHLQPVEYGEDDAAATDTLSVQSQSAINWPGILGSIIVIGLIVFFVWRKGRKQRQQGVLLGLILGLALSVFLATPVRAAAPHGGGDPDYCSGTGGVAADPTRCYSTSELLEYMVRWGVTEIGTGAARSFDEAIWLIDRLLAGLFDLTVNTPILAEITDAFLKIANTLMPNVLRQVVMGSSGLFYIAVALSGVLMAIPLWSGGSKLVRPERAIAWGFVLAVLFISGSQGYDLVTAIETLRSQMVQQVMSGSVDAKEVVTGPMQASNVSIDAGTSWKLPDVFEKQYFPDPVRQIVTVYLFEPGFPLSNASSGNTEVETDESMLNRQLAAGNSLMWAVLSLMGAIMLLLAAVTFAFMAVAAMLLILFLFAALPLGFFEFGNTILASIIGKYLNVVMLSLAMAIFMRWVTAGISLIGSSSDIAGATRYLVIILVMIYALSVISGSAFRLLTDSGQVWGQSIQAVFGQGPNIMGGLGGAFTGGLTGALLGGPAGAVAGALGGAFQGGGQEGGNSSASVVTASLLSAAGARVAGLPVPSQQNPPPPRGDVFVDAERAAEGSAPAPHSPALAQLPPVLDQAEALEQDHQQPGTGLFTPSPAEAETILQTLAGREGWQDEQVEMIKAASRRSESAARLAVAPGFEHSSPDSLQRALRAAQFITPDPLAGAGPLTGTGPLVGQETEKA